jgi:hypothetical protein
MARLPSLLPPSTATVSNAASCVARAASVAGSAFSSFRKGMTTATEGLARSGRGMPVSAETVVFVVFSGAVRACATPHGHQTAAMSPPGRQ